MDFGQVPPVTRAWLGLTLAVTVAEHVGLVSQFQLWFSPRQAFVKGEIWRVLTCFLYFGQLEMASLLHIFFTIRYSWMLEDESFEGRKADYVWLIFLSSVFLLVLSPFSGQEFLGYSLSFVLLYIWSRRNPHIHISLFGLVTLPAPYFPLAWVALESLFFATNQPFRMILSELIAVPIAHLYYFLVDVWPREYRSGGQNLLKTPKFLCVSLSDAFILCLARNILALTYARCSVTVSWMILNDMCRPCRCLF